MQAVLTHGRNLGRITFLELLWGLRIPETVVYNFVVPSAILVLLGLIRSGGTYGHILVPGMLSLVLASGCMQGIGTAVSYMRLYGSWKTVQASPIPMGLYFGGLIGSRVVRVVLLTSFLLLIAAVVLGYRFEGSLLLHLLWILLGSLVFAALGLVIAYLVRSPQAVSSVLNAILMPMIFTSNVFFVVDIPWVRYLSYSFPLTFLVDLLRANASGAGLGEHGLRNVVVLLVWLMVCGWGALILARRRVEEA